MYLTTDWNLTALNLYTYNESGKQNVFSLPHTSVSWETVAKIFQNLVAKFNYHGSDI